MATLSTAARNAALDALTAFLDSGAGRTTFSLRGAGFTPVLVSISVHISEPAWAAASGGSASINGLPWTVTAFGTGTAASYVIFNGSNQNTISQDSGGVGLIGSGADIELTSTDIRAGQQIRFSSFQLTLA